MRSVPSVESFSVVVVVSGTLEPLGFVLAGVAGVAGVTGVRRVLREDRPVEAEELMGDPCFHALFGSDAGNMPVLLVVSVGSVSVVVLDRDERR